MYENHNREIEEIIVAIDKAKNITDFEEICIKLDKIYMTDGKLNDNFRHEYSVISGNINELAATNKIQLDSLCENVNMVYDYAKEKNKPFLKQLFKLKDHINLEVFRMKYADKKEEDLRIALQSHNSAVNQINSAIENIERVVSGIEDVQQALEKKNAEVKNTQAKINQANDIIEEKQKRIEEQQEKIKNQAAKIEKQIENNMAQYMSILGIFSAVVLAFVGGLTFSTSVLENIHKASIYRIVFVVAIIGIVFFNLLWILFDFMKSVSGVDKQKKTVFFIVNGILIFIMLATSVEYKFRWFTGKEETVIEQNIEEQVDENKLVEDENGIK